MVHECQCAICLQRAKFLCCCHRVIIYICLRTATGGTGAILDTDGGSLGSYKVEVFALLHAQYGSISPAWLSR